MQNLRGSTNGIPHSPTDNNNWNIQSTPGNEESQEQIMPYIKQESRPQFDNEIESLVKKATNPKNENRDGDANYIISRIVAGIFKPEGGWRYYAIARAMGCFVCAMFELYMRIARPYEDKAIQTNGDIPEYKNDSEQ